MDNSVCNSDDSSKSQEQEVICQLCDCCTNESVMVCKVYFVVYIIVFVALVTISCLYKYYRKKLNVNMQSPTEISKRYIVFSVGIWMFSRFFYFGISFFPMHETSGYICMLEFI